MPENKAMGKIGGGMFILILIILFIAAHGGSNEMMYVTLLFVFIAIALFSYGFWSAVNKGEGIWQYMGKHDLQHQQISNPNYHFGSFRNYKAHPQKNVHICAPPKMGGARLNIYTIPLNNSLQRNPSVSSMHRPLGRNMSTNRSHRNHQHRGSVRQKQEPIDEQIKVEVYPEEDQNSFQEIQIPVPSINKTQ